MAVAMPPTADALSASARPPQTALAPPANFLPRDLRAFPAYNRCLTPMEMSNTQTVSAPAKRGLLRSVIDPFDSIWLGVFWISLILVYSAAGSAVPIFRQYFELTEFQFFNHWVFVTLIAMFCLTLVVTTLRRIRFNLRNLGVLTVHSGLLILCGASVIYFGGKIEGDAWLDAPRIRVLSVDRFRADPSNATIASFVAVEGRTWDTTMPALGGRHRVEVASVDHDGLVTASRVELHCQIGDGPPETIVLDQSAPDGVFAKLGEKLALWLVPANVCEAFYDETMPVLIARHRGHAETFDLPQLPYYHERFVTEAEEILDLNGDVVASDRISAIPLLERWRMPIDLTDARRAIAHDWPIRLEIDGYLPYARLEPTARPGGEQVIPLARVALSSGDERHTDWLMATVPSRSSFSLASGATAEFRWLGEADEIPPDWTRSRPGRHVLDVFIKDKNVRQTYEVSPGMEIAVEGTDYRLTVEQLQPNWPLMTPGFEGVRTPIALIWVDAPGQSFQRSVLQRHSQLNQDRDRGGKKIHLEKNLVDENIELTYNDAAHDHYLIVASSRMSPTLIHTAPGGQRTLSVLKSDKPVEYGDSKLTLREFIEKPRFGTAPVVIPLRNRRAFGTVRRSESLLRVHLQSKDGRWSRRVWVPFSQYNTEHDLTTATVVGDVPGMGDLELIYGRAVRPLPARLCLERLQTDFYPGRQQPSGWASYFRRQTPDGRLERDKAFLNNTARVGEWTLFQSQASGDHESWTVLGVGNRKGVMSMLLGCTLISLGMAYAFCVKPVLVRRRREALAAASGSRRARPSATPGMAMIILCASLTLLSSGCKEKAESAPPAAAPLKQIQDQIETDTLGAIALQHGWRYSVVDSWARDAVKAIHGRPDLFGLKPVVAAMELLFNAPAYDAEPIIYLKDRALRQELSAHPAPISDEAQSQLIETGLVSRAFLRDPIVAGRIAELNQDMLRSAAMNRLGSAVGHYDNLAALCTIVPVPGGESDTPWMSVRDIVPHAGQHSSGKNVFSACADLQAAWLARDAAAINAAIAGLAEVLPTLAADGVYPTIDMREAEVSYRRMGILRYAWAAYIVAFFVAIFAVATQYRWVRGVGLFALIVAVGLHGYDIALRWNVIGRIPVANMYEAVVSSTWVGAAFGLLLELFLRKRVYLLSAALLGFFALALPELLPDQIDNKLSGMMPILDDIMLRIHTVLIISSYAVITLAFGVANCYLFVSAFRDRVRLAQGTIGAELGAGAAVAVLIWRLADTMSGYGMVLFVIGSIAAGIGLLIGACGVLLKSKPAIEGPSAELFPVRRQILEEFDLSHRVLLYTAMIALFVGIVLGAVWADYSWGRPWGWDPKEVFALNTWLIYAILIHVRFVTRRRALVTSVLSVFGFAAMQFNWWVVNFYIVGLHSYA